MYDNDNCGGDKMQWMGAVFGIYVLITIGLYHVLIVKLEERFGTSPWAVFLLVGLICLAVSIFAGSSASSMFWGYNSFINLWSVKEMFDQHQRTH
jgi:hypothetical protein